MTENICGFKCNKINGKYIYPRSKLNKKYWNYDKENLNLNLLKFSDIY